MLAQLQTYDRIKKVLDYEWSGRKVLVTGASGFKGSWLCKVLLELGAMVYGVTRKMVDPLSAYNILDLYNEINFVQVNAEISDRQQVFDVINAVAPDVIFHLAAKAQVPIARRDPLRTFEVNIIGTINILEACRQLEVGKRVLIISTDHVFGSTKENLLPTNGFDTNCCVGYGAPYDTSKSAMELCVRSYHQTYWKDLPAIGITRAANVFGYGDVGYRRVIPLFLRSAVHDPHEIILKYRLNGRQFIHITDVINGYIRAASFLKEDDPEINQEKFDTNFPNQRDPFTPTFHFALENYGSYSINRENFIRMEKLAHLIVKDICHDLNAKIIETSDILDFAPDESLIQAINCSKTHKDIAWQPRITIEAGLKKQKEWYLLEMKQASLSDYKKMMIKDIEQIKNNLFN